MAQDDFFEDDLDYEEIAPRKKPKAKGKSKGSPVKTPARGEESEQPMLSLNWVIAIAVAALIVGFVARGVIQPAQSQIATPTGTAPTVQQGQQGGSTTLPPGHPQVQPGQQAPPLTEEQIKKGVPGGSSSGPGGSGKSSDSKSSN